MVKTGETREKQRRDRIAFRRPSIVVAAWGIIGLAVCGFLWQVASQIFGPLLVPSPSAVWEAIRSGWGNIPAIEYVGYAQIGYSSALRFTVISTLSAVAVGTFIGTILGLAMGEFRTVRYWLQPVLMLALTMPVLIALPFFEMWFGANRMLAMSLVALYAAVTAVVVVKEATTTVGDQYRNYGLSLGASRFRIVRSVTLPAVTPDVISAARVATAGGWGFSCIAEVISGEPGMGRLIKLLGSLSDMAGMMGGVIVLSAVAVGADMLLLLVGRVITQWQE